MKARDQREGGIIYKYSLKLTLVYLSSRELRSINSSVSVYQSSLFNRIMFKDIIVYYL